MKVAEILRKLASLVDTIEDDGESATDDTGVMIPPLQQQIELQKKEVGIDSAFDTTEEDPDEIAVLKINAGV
jgi:hypothetical protein